MQDRKLLLFFIKFLSLLLVVTLLLLGLNHLYTNGFYYTDTYGEVQKFKSVPTGITIANTGTSHGLASFRWSEAEVDAVTFNFALSGEDIYHDYHTLKQFASHLAEGCIVAIPTSYFSFCMSTAEPSQKRYYAYMDQDYLRGFSYETLINAKYLPILRSGEFLFKDLIKDHTLDVGGMMVGDDNAVTPDTGNAEQRTQVSASEALEAALRSHALGRAESWRSGFLVTGSGYMAENRDLLIEMVNYCKAQGWRPILITTPIHHTLNEAFSDAELETYYFSNMRLVSEATSTPWWDMSHDEHFSQNASYYSNSDHLSAAGGTEYTRRFLAYLTENNYL